MNKKEQEEHFINLINECKKLLLSKGDDYAGTDRLENFKIAGSMAGGDAISNCFNLICTKNARIKNLINNTKNPNHESINDSIKDMINYLVLLDMIIKEKNNNTQESKCVYYYNMPMDKF